ncbi:PREDICTED: ATP-binding cassette sub-family C member 9-like [Priapulus caudatus]|uniref:ATP-binding cassette sub-family C member 9-like n=1 Tax=Priapulus caudatus TaxID=37621 RepID=A0ABM1FC00_PRICU|nr:PREDICTED: ATP-binding cassette sub-family C member 9-like [Priapulus caudatus]
MDAGTIVHQGALEELQQRDCHLLERLKEHLKQYTDVDEGQTEAERQHLKKTLSLESLCGMHHNRSLSGGSTDEETPLQSQYGDDANTTKTQLMGSEERQTGAVVWRVWWAYMLACGAAMSMLVIWLHLVREGIKICMDFWLSAWAMPSHATAIYEYNSSNITTGDTGGDDGDVGYYLRGYTLLSFSTVAVTLLSSILAEVLGLRGARNLHRSLLNNIVLCPVRCFRVFADARVLDGGENFSVGQRQLVCLARAVLRDSAIIVMDEATGALDGATVDTLQRAIATAFAGKTLITIAHRLSTILEHDTIVVLDRHRRGGEIVEQGTPRSLLQNPDSSFYSLVKQQQLL